MAAETTPRHAGLSNGPIYLDYNATTPVDPRVVEAALPYLTEHFGNPSSTHHYGQAARQAIGQARGEVADLLGADPGEIVFTAGGSDSDTLAIRGAARANRDRGDHLITQATEHPAVLEACRSLQSDGFRLTILPVNHHGQVDPADLEQAVTGDTALVSITWPMPRPEPCNPSPSWPGSPAPMVRCSTPTLPRPRARSRST